MAQFRKKRKQFFFFSCYLCITSTARLGSRHDCRVVHNVRLVQWDDGAGRSTLFTHPLGDLSGRHELSERARIADGRSVRFVRGQVDLAHRTTGHHRNELVTVWQGLGVKAVLERLERGDVTLPQKRNINPKKKKKKKREKLLPEGWKLLSQRRECKTRENGLLQEVQACSRRQSQWTPRPWWRKSWFFRGDRGPRIGTSTRGGCVASKRPLHGRSIIRVFAKKKKKKKG